MNYFTKLKLKLMRKDWKLEKSLFPESSYKIVYAFTCDGVDYYKFDDTYTIPYLRALTAIVFYREVQMNIDVDILKAHCEAVENMCDEGLSSFVTKGTVAKLNINQAIENLNKIKLNATNMKIRTQMPTDVDLLYKLASIVYFDKSESPVRYDFKYNKNKIEDWKKLNAKGSYDFFLQQPIQQLIPYLKHLSGDTHQLLEAVEMMKQTSTTNDLIWKNISSQLLQEQRMKYEDKLTK